MAPKAPLLMWGLKNPSQMKIHRKKCFFFSAKIYSNTQHSNKKEQTPQSSWWSIKITLFIPQFYAGSIQKFSCGLGHLVINPLWKIYRKKSHTCNACIFFKSIKMAVLIFCLWHQPIFIPLQTLK